MTAQRHLRLSIAVVGLFLAMGLWLEAMYGLRAEGWIDDPLRREFLRLGHSHGALLGLVNVALAWGIERLETPAAWAAKIRLAAWIGALLVGVGFVAGGLTHGPTDPGPPILMVPAGALMTLTATVAVALVRPTDVRPRAPQP